MIDAIYRFEDKEIVFNILSFQTLSETEIDHHRRHLFCPGCDSIAFYRQASKDGKTACFGSRYHPEDCLESRRTLAQDVNSQETDAQNTLVQNTVAQKEQKDADAVNQLIETDVDVVFDFSYKAPSKISTSTISASKTEAKQEEKLSIKPIKSSANEAEETKEEKETNNQPAKPKRLAMQAALNSLMRGSNLATSDVKIELDAGYQYRAKNLFVNFVDSDSVTADNKEQAKPKMFWGTVSHSDQTMEWLNPLENDKIGIPIKRYKDELFKRFNIEERRDLEGAGIMIFGKCYWNAAKTRQIIEPWNIERILLVVEK